MKNKPSSSGNLFVRIAIGVFLVFCIVSVIRLRFQYNQLIKQKEELTSDIAEYRDTIDALKEQISEPYDEEYIKRVAREKLNYHMPEEIIFYNDLEK